MNPNHTTKWCQLSRGKRSRDYHQRHPGKVLIPEDILKDEWTQADKRRLQAVVWVYKHAQYQSDGQHRDVTRGRWRYRLWRAEIAFSYRALAKVVGASIKWAKVFIRGMKRRGWLKAFRHRGAHLVRNARGPVRRPRRFRGHPHAYANIYRITIYAHALDHRHFHPLGWGPLSDVVSSSEMYKKRSSSTSPSVSKYPIAERRYRCSEAEARRGLPRPRTRQRPRWKFRPPPPGCTQVFEINGLKGEDESFRVRVEDSQTRGSRSSAASAEGIGCSRPNTVTPARTPSSDDDDRPKYSELIDMVQEGLGPPRWRDNTLPGGNCDRASAIVDAMVRQAIANGVANGYVEDDDGAISARREANGV